jgi:hypothetical protein
VEILLLVGLVFEAVSVYGGGGLLERREESQVRSFEAWEGEDAKLSFLRRTASANSVMTGSGGALDPEDDMTRHVWGTRDWK